MVSVIISSLAAYISTEIDDFLSLLILMGAASSRKEKIAICLGKFAGLFIIAGASLLMADYISKIPSHFVGFLGLIPIGIAVKKIISSIKSSSKNLEEDDAKEIEEKKESMLNARSIMIFLTCVIITLASGFDNLAVYIPYFTTLEGWNILICVLVFIVLQAASCFASMAIVNIDPVKKLIAKCQNFLMPILFILLGLYILFQKGSIAWLFGWK